MYTSKLDQILDKEFIQDRNNKTNGKINNF